jgi:hypothetical protein
MTALCSSTAPVTGGVPLDHRSPTCLGHTAGLVSLAIITIFKSTRTRRTRIVGISCLCALSRQRGLGAPWASQRPLRRAQRLGVWGAGAARRKAVGIPLEWRQDPVCTPSEGRSR